MEADWEMEIGPDAPMIDGAWSGLVDLRTEPDRAAALAETAELPVLEPVLGRLNGPRSPVWTSKCDVWQPPDFDRDEMDAPPDSSHAALASYLDLLPQRDEVWSTIEEAADWCRGVCLRLRSDNTKQCRVDLVVRRACITAELTGLGVTAYLTACASDTAAAAEVLSRAIRIFADAVCENDDPPEREDR